METGHKFHVTGRCKHVETKCVSQSDVYYNLSPLDCNTLLYELWIRFFTWCSPKVVGQVGIINCERSLWTWLFDKKGCLRPPATFPDIFRHVLIALIPCHGTQACSAVNLIAVHFVRASQVNHHEDQQWMPMTCLMRLALIDLNVLSRIVQF